MIICHKPENLMHYKCRSGSLRKYGSRQKRRMLDCQQQCGVRDKGSLLHTVMKDTKKGAMRPMEQMVVTSVSRAFQPPTYSQDWVQARHHDARETMHESPGARERHKVFSRPFRTYRNRCQHYLSRSMDCKNLTTDCTRDLPARCYTHQVKVISEYTSRLY